MLYAVTKNHAFNDIKNRLETGADTEAALREIRDICQHCRPSSPIMCIELCQIWDLKSRYQEAFEALDNKPNVTKLLKLTKNSRRQKILETLTEGPATLTEIKTKLLETGLQVSTHQLLNTYIKPLIDASLVSIREDLYAITRKGENIFNIVTKTNLATLPFDSKGHDEKILEALFSGPKSYDYLTDIVPKGSLYRSLSRLREMGLIIKSDLSGRVFYFATKRRPTRKLSSIEMKIFKALTKEGLSVKDLSETVGISVRRVYKYLKQLRYKQHVSKREKPIFWKVTEKGRQLAESLNMAYNLIKV